MTKPAPLTAQSDVTFKRPGGYDVTPETREYENEETRSAYADKDAETLAEAGLVEEDKDVVDEAEEEITEEAAKGSGEKLTETKPVERTRGGISPQKSDASKKGKGKEEEGEEREGNRILQFVDGVVNFFKRIWDAIKAIAAIFGIGGGKKDGKETPDRKGPSIDGDEQALSPEQIAQQQMAQIFAGLKSLLGISDDKKKGAALEEELPVVLGAMDHPDDSREDQAQAGREMLSAPKLNAEAMSKLVLAVGLDDDQLEVLQAVLAEHGVQCEIGERDEPEAVSPEEQAQIDAAIAASMETAKDEAAEAEADRQNLETATALSLATAEAEEVAAAVAAVEEAETKEAIAAVAKMETDEQSASSEGSLRDLAADFARSPDGAALEDVSISDMEAGEAAQGTTAVSTEVSESRGGGGRSD